MRDNRIRLRPDRRPSCRGRCFPSTRAVDVSLPAVPGDMVPGLSGHQILVTCDLLDVSEAGQQSGQSAGATVGGSDVLLAVVGAAVWLEPMAAMVAHPTSATTARVMNAYDSHTPTSARSRPRSPVRRIWASPRCPKTAPAGAKTNANTSDNVANALMGGRAIHSGTPPRFRLRAHRTGPGPMDRDQVDRS